MKTNGYHSKLKQHIDPTHMEFLPFHYLLSTVVRILSHAFHEPSLHLY